MANEEQLAILRQGVEVWNRWREENPNAKISLSGAELREVNLYGAFLSRVDLTGADIIGADLRKASLELSHLDFAGLTGANLTGANLVRVDLSEADVNGADFSDTAIGFTNLTGIDLSRAIGLERVNHLFPSHISIDTLQRSQGKIPEVFLRGCGLSDWEIEAAKLYSPNLSNEEVNIIQYKLYDRRATQAPQISPLFISYSHADKVFVDKVETKLNQKGVRFWRDIHNMKAGRIETQIDQAISQNRIVLLILSEHSLKSDWVEHEVRKAREQEKGTGRDVLCPIALDDSWKSSRWPARIMEQIKEYNILDFSEWEDDVKFDGMFRKLIDGLELFYKG